MLFATSLALSVVSEPGLKVKMNAKLRRERLANLIYHSVSSLRPSHGSSASGSGPSSPSASAKLRPPRRRPKCVAAPVRPHALSGPTLPPGLFHPSVKPLVTGPQPVAWAAERWLPAVWSMQLDTGWARLPPLAEDKLKRAHQAHAPATTLEAGEFGEQKYLVGLLNGVAKTDAKPFAERRVRRAPLNY